MIYSEKTIHAVMWGTYDLGKPRTRIIRDGLRKAGVALTECHTDIWYDVEDKSRIQGFWKKAKYLVRWIAAYPNLIVRYIKLPPHDVVIVGYGGQLDILILWPIARLRRVAIIWDPLLSLYNTLVEHRRWVSRGSIASFLIYALDWLACRSADFIVLNTRRGADYFVVKFHLPGNRTDNVFIGAETDLFKHRGPFRAPSIAKSEWIRILFYGTFLPAHSVETIIAAARLPTDLAIEWILVGEGQEATKIEADLERHPIHNLSWTRWVDYEKLPELISSAHLCLGHFGDDEIAEWAIPNKIYQILATGTPLLTRDGAGIRELIPKRTAGFYLVPPKAPNAIIVAIAQFVEDWPLLEGQVLHKEIIKRFEPAAFGRKYRQLIIRLIGDQKRTG